MSELSRALHNYMKAIRAYARADERCDEDPDYFLADEREAVAKAEADYLDALTNALEAHKRQTTKSSVNCGGTGHLGPYGTRDAQGRWVFEIPCPGCPDCPTKS